MSLKYLVSKPERILLLGFVTVAFVLFATGIASEVIQAYNESVVRQQKELARQAGVKNIISFAVHGFFYTIPLYNLITLPILIALFKPGKYIISSALTLIYLAFLILSISSRLDGRGALGSERFFTDPWLELSVKTTFYDHSAAFVIAVLIIWQGSILLRSFLRHCRNIELA